MSRGSKYGQTWWGNAWVTALEKIDYYTNRLPRGRKYANAGRVSAINLAEKGLITASVQGSRSRPYKVEIKLTLLPLPRKRFLKPLSPGIRH